MIAVEDKIRSGHNEAYIANSREYNIEFEICHCGDENPIKATVDGLTILANTAEFGTFNKGAVGIVIHYSYDKSTNKISMRCKYYILDYYDFENISTLKFEDAVGYAKSFELFGVCEAEYTWTKGKCDLVGGVIE